MDDKSKPEDIAAEPGLQEPGLEDPGTQSGTPESPPVVAAEEAATSTVTSTVTAQAGKTDIGKRAIAYIIDAVVVYAIGLIPVLGGLIGAAYMLSRDGLEYDFMDRRSVGKKLMKLRPVRLDGQAMTLTDSIKRNWPLVFGSLAQLLLVIPVLGWILFPLLLIAAIVVGILELVFVLTDAEGRRWGDRLAGTKVIEVES